VVARVSFGLGDRVATGAALVEVTAAVAE